MQLTYNSGSIPVHFNAVASRLTWLLTVIRLCTQTHRLYVTYSTEAAFTE